MPTSKGRKIGKLGHFGEGTIAVDCGGRLLKLFPGALLALQQYVHNRRFLEGTRIAVASSAVTPLAVDIAYAALNMLEVFPGISVREVLRMGWEQHGDGFEGNIKIGRSYPLSASKADTHFPLLQRDTGMKFENMLYFDDCIWDDHCSHVGRRWGVVTWKTPRGLQERDWYDALVKYDREKSK